MIIYYIPTYNTSYGLWLLSHFTTCSEWKKYVCVNGFTQNVVVEGDDDTGGQSQDEDEGRKGDNNTGLLSNPLYVSFEILK